jgi:predicted ribosomally synthesized peptide with SipW-like signal peptide
MNHHQETSTTGTWAGLSAPTIEVSRRRTGRMRSALALGTLVGVGVVGTFAAFSDTATVSTGFTAGTLDITVDDEEGNPTPYDVVFTGAEAMAPGDVVYSALKLTNVGSIDSELSMSTAVVLDPLVGNVTESLTLTIAHTTGTVCDATVVDDDVAPYLEDEPLVSATVSSVPLAGGDDLSVCLAVTLPGTVTGIGGGGSDVELEFLAEQVS